MFNSVSKWEFKARLECFKYGVFENYEKIYQKMQELLRDESFKEDTRVSANCFIRDRKLTFTELMVFTLRSAHKTMQVEVAEFFDKLSNGASPPSKQAISKARQKIRYTGFRKMNDVVLDTFYNEPHKTYKGYRLLAVDGSILELPTGKAITTAFGTINKQARLGNAARSVMVYDVLNNMIVDAQMHPAGSSERICLMEQTARIRREGKQRKDIIIADRGFPSLPLMMRLKRDNYDFVIRYNGKNFLRECNEFAAVKQTDKIISVALDAVGHRGDDGILKALIKEGMSPTVKLRVVKIPLSNGTTEYLVTSILDKKVLSRSDLNHIYRHRWGIEEAYKMLKTTLEVENFSGKTEETLLQEYYAKALVYNLHYVLIREAQKQLDDKMNLKAGSMKYARYKINQNVSYGMIRTHLLKLLTQDHGNWEEAYDYLVSILQRNYTAVRPLRVYSRQKQRYTKYYINRRRAA